MSISSMNLDAFFEVCKLESFTLAAKSLGITQSALSQRILNLERELELILFIRDKKKIIITEYGQSLLNYCLQRASMEEDFFTTLRGHNNELFGELRIVGFSSVVRSIVLPKLHKVFGEKNHIHLSLSTKELREIPSALYSGDAHFAFYNKLVAKNGIVSRHIFNEKYILIESSEFASRDVYLDHDPEDETTYLFLRKQNKQNLNIKRVFFDEIYSIIDAVSLGMGRAVIPEHLVSRIEGVKVVKKLEPMISPVYMLYREQSYIPKVQRIFRDSFREI